MEAEEEGIIIHDSLGMKAGQKQRRINLTCQRHAALRSASRTEPSTQYDNTGSDSLNLEADNIISRNRPGCRSSFAASGDFIYLQGHEFQFTRKCATGMKGVCRRRHCLRRHHGDPGGHAGPGSGQRHRNLFRKEKIIRPKTHEPWKAANSVTPLFRRSRESRAMNCPYRNARQHRHGRLSGFTARSQRKKRKDALTADAWLLRHLTLPRHWWRLTPTIVTTKRTVPARDFFNATGQFDRP